MEFELDSETVFQAAERLNLYGEATVSEIKARYRELTKKWHPDQCEEKPEECEEEMKDITRAYKIVMDYCNNYRYSFREGDIKEKLSPEEHYFDEWKKQFGDNPL